MIQLRVFMIMFLQSLLFIGNVAIADSFFHRTSNQLVVEPTIGRRRTAGIPDRRSNLHEIQNNNNNKNNNKNNNSINDVELNGNHVANDPNSIITSINLIPRGGGSITIEKEEISSSSGFVVTKLRNMIRSILKVGEKKISHGNQDWKGIYQMY
jgi:hypothetical protein